MSRVSISADPYPYLLPESGVCLIVIDMQRDFLEMGGYGAALGNDVDQLRGIIPTVERLLQACRDLSLPIIHTREAHQPDLSDCPPSKRSRGAGPLTIGDVGPMGRILIDGEPGNDIIAPLQPLPGEYEITKPGKGAFYNTTLSHILSQLQVTHLLFAGVTTEVCVQTSMREANDRGYECLLVSDATASYFPAFKDATLAMLTAQNGIVGWVADSAQVIAALECAYGR